MSQKPASLDEQSFDREVLQSQTPVLVDFYADWCGPCRTIAPVIEELANDFDGRATVAKVNVDEQRGLATRFQVRSIPTLLFFRDGEVVEQITGVAPKKVLAGKLEELAAAA